jgi:hypothetical protein
LVGRSKRYHKIGYSEEKIDRLLVDLYIESSQTALVTGVPRNRAVADIPSPSVDGQKST